MDFTRPAEPMLQLAEPAMQAECEGLCGRAWQSVAAKKRREVKYRKASTAFEALYGQPEDDNNEQEDDTDGEECSSEGEPLHNPPIVSISDVRRGGDCVHSTATRKRCTKTNDGGSKPSFPPLTESMTWKVRCESEELHAVNT